MDTSTVNENQEKLKNCRKAFLESIPKKQGLSQHLIDNPIKLTNISTTAIHFVFMS